MTATIALVRDTFREFGVALYHKSEVTPGGELSQVYRNAPSVHIIDHVIYHTTLDTAELVPAWGLEDATRAFLKIIDNVNTMKKAEEIEKLAHKIRGRMRHD